MLIGDPAFAAQHVLLYFDLDGVEGAGLGLPFVFAAWIAQAARSTIPRDRHARAFHSTRARRHRALVGAQHGGEPAFYERYLTAHMQYRLDPRFEAGLSEFRGARSAQGWPRSQPAFRGTVTAMSLRAFEAPWRDHRQLPVRSRWPRLAWCSTTWAGCPAVELPRIACAASIPGCIGRVSRASCCLVS